MNRNLYLITGPSGAGKTVIADMLTDMGYRKVQSYTTRPRRTPGETGYSFIFEHEFDELRDQIITETKYQGYHYGATASQMDAADLYILEPSGVYAVLQKYKHRPVVVIGITAPLHVLEQRMKERGDAEDKIKSRLEGDCTLFGCMTDYCDVVFRNTGSIAGIAQTVNEYIQFKEQCAKQAASARYAAEYSSRKPLCLPAMSQTYLRHRHADTFIVPAEFPAEDGGMRPTDMGEAPAYEQGETLFWQEPWRVSQAWQGSNSGCIIEFKDGSTQRIEGDILAVPDKDGSWLPANALHEKGARCFAVVKSIKAMRVQDVDAELALKLGVTAARAPILNGVNFPTGMSEWSDDRRDEWFKSTARAKYIAECEYAEQLVKEFAKFWDAQYGNYRELVDKDGKHNLVRTTYEKNPVAWIVEITWLPKTE